MYVCMCVCVCVCVCVQVVLAAGAVQTPKILMLSGIGDRDHLTSFNKSTRVHLPGVGKNLQDHTFFPLIFNLNADSPLSYRRQVLLMCC